MKQSKRARFLLGVLFALLFSISAVGCFLTGCELPVASKGRLLFFCILFSVLPPLLTFFRHGIWVFLLLTAQGGYYLWQDGALWEQLQTFAYTLTDHYAEAYDWPVFGTPLSEELDLVLILWAFLTAVSAGLCICFGNHMSVALPTVILPIILCLVTLDTIPHSLFLYLIILGILLLLLLDWTREYNPTQSLRLVLQTLIPLAAVLGLVFFLNPKEEYVNHAAGIADRITQLFREEEEPSQPSGGGTVNIGQSEGEGEPKLQSKLNLRYVGPKRNLRRPVMQVLSSCDGAVYLRGRDYDIYTGMMWESTENRNERFTEGASASESLTISTFEEEEILFTPYYSTGVVRLTGGFLKNREGSTVYGYYISRASKNTSPDFRDYSQYTVLPEHTYDWAVDLISRVLSGGALSDSEKAEDIAEFVRKSASYDISTGYMSNGRDDFAKWFLEESDTGYCIHFATAATVLLRAAGVPARYVEGYMIQCEADVTAQVTEKEAHAWAEYYDSDSLAWKVLEATPSLSEDGEETTPLETDAAETEPQETETSPAETEPPLETAEDDHMETVHKDPDSQGGSEQNPDKTKKPFRIPNWVKNVGIVLACLAVIPIQGEIRIAIKRKRWNGGSPNELAVVRFRMCRQLAKRTRSDLPRELDELAQKAVYSQHTLTESELERFDLFRTGILESVGTLSPIRKAVFRWIFAVGA